MLVPWLNWTHTSLLGDPFHPTRNITTLPLFFGGPMDQVTKHVCREISSSNVTSTSSSSRCMTLLSQSMRSLRIKATTADADLYDFRRDGLILMLTYVYDDDSMVYNNNNKSMSHVDYCCPVDMQHQEEMCNTTQQRYRPQICVFGEFSLQITALAYLMRFNLHWVFASGNDEMLTTPEAFDTLLSTWKKEGLHLTYATATDTDDGGLSWQSLLRKQGTESDVECDVWHFRVDTAGHLLTHIFTSNSSAITRAAQVVWESTMNVGDTLDMFKPPDILPSVLHWDAFSLWPVCTVFNGMTDAEGFSGARAVALDFKLDLRLYSVWVGHINPLSSELLTDSMVPLTTSTTTEDNKVTSMMNNDEDMFTTMTTNPTVVIAITYTNRVFDDNAYGLRDVLLSMGYHHVFVMGDFSLSTVRQWQNRFQSGRKPLFLQIALGPHELCMLTPYYIAYNMEQPWSMYFTDASHSVGYRMLLAGALAIFTFSNHHRDGIIQLSEEYDLGIRVDRIFNIPIYITTENGPEINKPLFRKNSHMSSLFVHQGETDHEIIGEVGEGKGDEDEDHAYDIAFFGGSSARRLAFFQRFQEHSERHEFNFRVVCGGWEVALFGDRRDYVVLRSRVVLNIHGTWQSSLELHRIQYLLSMGAAVVSERSAVDPHLDEEYADAVVFGGDASAILGSGTINTAEFFSGQIGDVEKRKNLGIVEDVEYVVTDEEIRNFDDILKKAFYLARNTTARREVERNAWQQYQKSVQNVTELHRAIESILLDVYPSP